MPDEPRRTYWDANVPLSYINRISDRVPVIDELLRQGRAGEIELGYMESSCGKPV